MLINSLLAHASDDSWEEFIEELERLNVRKAVVVWFIISHFKILIQWVVCIPAINVFTQH